MLNFLQKIGKSLMFPIATLPAAALLVRIGYEDMLDIPFMTAAGNGILSNLALIFAIGIAMGFAHDNSGAAAMSGAIGYLVLTSGITAINDSISMGVFAGIIAGVVAGLLYNRFYAIKLPDWLAFFGGKRFVPIITSAAMVLLAALFGYTWAPVQSGIDAIGEWILNAGAIGVGAYGFFNRLLIPVGLHHVINTMIWFDFGTFINAQGETVRGEINRFLNGDPNAGAFLAGFFPVMMFGLPAACLAMYVTAKKERKAAVGGFFISIALTAFLTGVTEPIEFTFMFLSPLLYVVHALLTGASMMIAFAFDAKHGFGFSAGVIDFILNYNLAQNPITLIFIGLGMGAVYFIIFYFLIIKLDLKTPGREDESELAENNVSSSAASGDGYDVRAYHTIEALGGTENIQSIDYCTTRLRLQVQNADLADEKALKRHGARGMMRISKTNLQVIIGTNVEFLADAMKTRVQNGNPEPAALSSAPAEKTVSIAKQLDEDEFMMPIEGKIIPLDQVPDEVFAQGMMGQGFGIEPSGDTFVSPVNGKVISLFPTKHAIGIETDTGIELLIHIGLDTVKLEGQGFETLVKEGQLVQQGTPLIKVDLAYIKEHAPSIVTPVIFTNLVQEKVHLLKTDQQPLGQTAIVTFK
ncbi:N-acetylglucosamine-specific PTS transporter subunit IIBC [Jeotgalibacillus soli]|uniref:PTS N-acetylglucosamine transporter subunit IIABC n=1 Tax=Jeotgalibacillus soli TaxID=889306 RepID=A0A0C2RHA9_9BACL|nr:N-acetylglucosamine-specific PTS transporter subunit IIBC [Jeotgalibacillus soli]KIL49535.1 PTS N-acetylglucosamine transporter subunit IIABC [Jeotgalibacillus soli]